MAPSESSAEEESSVDASPESIFGSSHIQKSARRLLDNYSNPWDPLAETVQNSVDAINTEYRARLAEELGVPLESDDESEVDLESAIESATEAVVDIDARSFDEVSENTEFDEFEREDLEEDAKWGDEAYSSWIKSQYYGSLARSLDMEKESAVSADQQVRDNYQGKLVVTRNIGDKGIKVKDNGIGMSTEDLGEALKRYGTLKDQDGKPTSQIGELGNGLTYVLANCNEFSIETCDGSTITKVVVEGMLDWVQGNAEAESVNWDTEILEEDTDDESYTIVRSADIRPGDSEFPDLYDERVTPQRVEHLLRNKTAIGQLFDIINYPSYHTLRSDDVDVEYVDTGPSGEPDQREVKFQFQGPSQVAKDAGEDPSKSFPTQLDIGAARERVADTSSDIGEKSVVARGVWQSSGGVKHYYEAFVASRDRYRELSREYGLCNDPSGSVDENSFDLEPGIEIGVKGMPCGIRIDTPVSGSAGYWGNLYIIIMNNDLSFDEGREKPATGRRGKNFKDCARDVLFSEIGKDVISGTTKGSGSTLLDDSNIIEDRTEEREALEYECLDQISFKNKPTTEQDVVAIFHEALAHSIFPDSYTGIDTSTWHTYDEIYNYQIDLDSDTDIIGSRVARGLRESGYSGLDEDIIIEFKKEGADIFQDLSSNKKIYSEIDLLICWEFDENNEMGITLSEKQPDEIWYWGTTHQLEIDSHLLFDASNQVDVIVLTELFERIDNDNYDVY